MDAALVTAIGALLASPLAAAAAVYGTRGATRVQREGGALTGYDNLTQRLTAERDKAEADEVKAEARALAAEARVYSLEAEISRLKQQVLSLGGQP